MELYFVIPILVKPTWLQDGYPLVVPSAILYQPTIQMRHLVGHVCCVCIHIRQLAHAGLRLYTDQKVLGTKYSWLLHQYYPGGHSIRLYECDIRLLHLCVATSNGLEPKANAEGEGGSITGVHERSNVYIHPADGSNRSFLLMIWDRAFVVAIVRFVRGFRSFHPTSRDQLASVIGNRTLAFPFLVKPLDFSKTDALLAY